MFRPNSIYLKKGSGISDDVYKKVLKKAGIKGMNRLLPGEKHAPLIMPDGSLQVGNYIGPGTQAVKRAMRGDRGITPVDDLAMRHDAFYSLAKSKAEIRKADEDFLRILKRGVVKDHPMNLRTAELGIASKYVAESKTGVLFPSDKELKMNNPNDQNLLNIIRMTNKMYNVQSGKGIMDVLQKIINWLFGSKIPKYDIPPEESREEEPREEEEPVKNKCKELLKLHGIVDSRSFKRWALRNHPDKVPDDKKNEATELFKEIVNCMESEQVGQGLIGDIVKGFTKDPIGSIVSIGSVVQKKEVWNNVDKFIREDETMQEIIKKTNDALDKVKSVVEDIPVVSDIAKLPFAGWDAFSDEYEQKDKSKQKPHTKNMLRDISDWNKMKQKYPDIGTPFLETITKEYGKLGMTKYKQQLPRIIADQLKRNEKYARYKEVEVKEELKKLAKEQIKILEKGDDRAKELLKVIKSAPRMVSKELMSELSANWDNKNPYVTDARITVWTKPKVTAPMGITQENLKKILKK